MRAEPHDGFYTTSRDVTRLVRTSSLCVEDLVGLDDLRVVYA
jgi:hypothetical protein